MKTREALFLQTLMDNKGSASRSALGFVDNAEARVRQACRRRGWAAFGILNNTGPNRWHITEAGFYALKEHKARHPAP